MFVIILIVFILGGTYVNKVGSAVDLNTLTTQGKYIVPNNNTNAPTTDYGLVLVEVRNSVIYQWFYRTGGVDCYYRVKNGNNEWISWGSYAFDIPSFYKNYNSISALANAMGAFTRAATASGDAALDSVKETSFRRFGGYTLGGEQNKYGICLTFVEVKTDTYAVQFACTFGSTPAFYMRSKYVSTQDFDWTGASWVKIATTTI